MENECHGPEDDLSQRVMDSVFGRDVDFLTGPADCGTLRAGMLILA